ncbi:MULTISPECIES: lipid-A-disaccharide synthase [Marinobacter]|uniref:Lipid-A-disaccharide synthase n=2 Tax=Marinobacter nauticus TaxID=2743 RepID=A0A833N9Q8_MARNT|nr:MULTISPECIES: lipid-A-disaccharide synthase [Marinobacter]MEC9040771.1 lipid-A-disaccharide synthase [Pseudomonadota bacterium]KAE8544073.1 Lipid-A-disaccharide synthase [Marinobacter nauticus]MAC23861.1 lipid-A-disaccharide synthase [Marinobacter sp.]MAL33353.1 lipid-A-disaccharide synthase [Marinobacter sp.]MEC9084684.1 lipid-A-disaccharide synthase [Pseudomonadota bacterium]
MTHRQANSATFSGRTIAIIAGEASGDILGAGLIRALRKRYPKARFVGIGGDEMIAEGFHSLVPMERLSVMGLVEVLGRIRELFSIRARLLDYLFTTPPDVVVGIDSPDFTLAIERRCREAGIPSVHYVSPSVWAWRQKRIFKIAKSVDLMLTLFPFEARFYEEHHVPVSFVGHPLADRIELEPDTLAARKSLGLEVDKPVLAVLPGSRGGEVERLGTLFLEASRWLQARRPDLQLVIPCVNRDRERQVRDLVESLEVSLPVTLVRGRSREVMAASDVVLLASGTATLEAMLLKKPMVVGYRLSDFSYKILSRLVKVPWVALPNLLAQEQLVPELLQDDATPEKLGAAVLERLENEQERDRLHQAFLELHQVLRQGADERAAAAVSELLESRS